MRCTIAIVLGGLVLAAGCSSPPEGRDAVADEATPAPAELPAWAAPEAPVLSNHVQLTFADQFVKAGEAYFSPDGRRIIFQATEVPAAGEEPHPHYHMYVGDLTRDGAGRISGLTNIRRLSPPGSANTCGWFHPTKPDTVLFGSTLVAPTAPDVAGYQRGSGRYRWQFPKEMTIVSCDLNRADGTIDTLDTIVADDLAYLAEGSVSKDGRTLLYCRYAEADAPMGGDLVVRDLASGTTTTIVDADGYDGGPFFSPDESMICYRSDRRGDNHLQIFAAVLERDATGRVTGIEREINVTDNDHVNWAPFWHPQGRHLVYATSEEGHQNYEVFMIDALAAGDPEDTKRRITFAERFDGLPVFNADGSVMMWTSQRSEDGTSQIWVADFDMP